MLNASLCSYSDAYIPVEGKITVVGHGADRNDKEVVFKNCAPFTSCISEINNAEVDNTDTVMPMYNVLEFKDNYGKTSASLWQYCSDEPDDDITNSKSFKFKSSVTDNTINAGIANIEIAVSFKYLSNFGELLKCH